MLTSYSLKLTSVCLMSIIGGYDFIIGHCQGVTGKNIFDLSGLGPDAKSYKFVFISIDNPGKLVKATKPGVVAACIRPNVRRG
ncbi:MAG: hypothetical protein JEZ07_10445 [Phycisphaerae bacterium]|nr:hypothetical protein [Phycisphaerae bacterium]